MQRPWRRACFPPQTPSHAPATCKKSHSGAIASDKPRLRFDCPKGRITRIGWVEENKVLLTSHDGGFVRRWDAETGEMLAEAQVCALCSCARDCQQSAGCAACCFTPHSRRQHKLPLLRS